MREQGGRPIDDEQLTERFERLVRLSGTPGPSLSDLEGRVVVRAHRRRVRRRVVLGVYAAALILLVGFVAVAVRSAGTDDDPTKLTSRPMPTLLPADPEADPVFTIAGVPEDLAFRSCTPLSTDTDPNEITGVNCTFDDPATAAADGLRITRLTAVNDPALTAAWDTGDGPAAARATGGSDDPDAARFITLGGTTVLDLTVAGQPSSDASAALQLLVGDHLVDIGATDVPLAELGEVASSLSMEPPSTVVSQALDALPEGAVALVQGERPLWVQPDPLEPQERSRFGGTTVGTEIAVPGSPTLIGVDVTAGIDADAFLDELLADDGAAFTETEIGGRRAVVLASDRMMPLTVPEPRPGPQLVVRLDDDVIIRVKDPDGDAAQIQAIAEALR